MREGRKLLQAELYGTESVLLIIIQACGLPPFLLLLLQKRIDEIRLDLTSLDHHIVLSFPPFSLSSSERE